MKSLISFIRRKILRLPTDRWNYQYEHGRWKGLLTEHARFDAVIKLIGSHYSKPSILEIGCGEAVMLRRMDPDSFTTFTGIDLSAVAIANSQEMARTGVTFVAADMNKYVPDGLYDVIVFNESLYYSKDPAQSFVRYIPYLKKGGSILVTAVENKYTAPLWPALDKSWQPLAVDVVKSAEHRWDIRLYRL